MIISHVHHSGEKMPWYIVYKAYARARDGKLYRRTYVKKLRNLLGKRLIGRPRIIEIRYDPETDHYLVDIAYKVRHKYRGRVTHPREHVFTVVIAQGKGHRVKGIRLTRHPPKGPKIDRK